MPDQSKAIEDGVAAVRAAAEAAGIPAEQLDGLDEDQLQALAAGELELGDVEEGDALEQLEQLDAELGAGESAATKILRTLRELSKPDPDAGEMELTLATVCMGLESSLRGELHEKTPTGEVDEFVRALCRFLAIHRSDHAKQLVVVELPAHTVHPELARGRTARAIPNLPPGTRLKLLDDAIAQAGEAPNPFA